MREGSNASVTDGGLEMREGSGARGRDEGSGSSVNGLEMRGGSGASGTDGGLEISGGSGAAG